MAAATGGYCEALSSVSDPYARLAWKENMSSLITHFLETCVLQSTGMRAEPSALFYIKI